MKNKGLYCLLLLCCICLAFTGGFFAGRNTNHSQIQLSTVPAFTPNTTAGTDTSLLAERVNINTATLQELDRLPGIGSTLAQRIIDYRNQKGPFSKVGDLINVEGIGTGKLDAILDFITTGG